MAMYIDKHGDRSNLTQDTLTEPHNDLNFCELEMELTAVTPSKQKPTKKSSSAADDIDLDEFEADMGWTAKSPKSKTKPSLNIKTISQEDDLVAKALQKTAVRSGFEQLNHVPRYDLSRKQKLARAQREREKTKGKKWFDLPAPAMTDELRHDLEVIRMRSALDRKHFYKKSDVTALPKYFQVGKVVDSPVEYYNGRLTKKQRKRTIVDELMADAEFSKYSKRKYKEVFDEKRKSHQKTHQHAKRLKKKK